MEILFLGVNETKPVSLVPAYNAKGLTVSYCKALLKAKSFSVAQATNPEYVLLTKAFNYVDKYNPLADEYSRFQQVGNVIYMPLSVFQEME